MSPSARSPSARSPSSRTAVRLLGALAFLLAVVAAGVLLTPDPLADVFFAGWVLACVAVAAVGAIAAWTTRRALLWLAALSIAALSIVGFTSVGLFVAPAALSLLVAAALSQWAVPRRTATPPARVEPADAREATATAVVGVAAAAVGGWLVYAGAFARELFGSCARETLECALETTHWDAVAATVVGLGLLAFGGWLCWRQLRAAWMRGSNHAG